MKGFFEVNPEYFLRIHLS